MTRLSPPGFAEVPGGWRAAGGLFTHKQHRQPPQLFLFAARRQRGEPGLFLSQRLAPSRFPTRRL